MRSRVTIALCVLQAVVLAVSAQTDSAKPQFKKPQVGMNESVQITGADGPAIGRPAAVDRNVVDDVETLEEKRETVDTELRYAKSKLEVAQKKLSVQLSLIHI